jgi:hypothetical protein
VHRTDGPVASAKTGEPQILTGARPVVQAAMIPGWCCPCPEHVPELAAKPCQLEDLIDVITFILCDFEII